MLVGFGLAAAAPAGASSSPAQTTFIKDIKYLDPNTAAVSNKQILSLGNGVCKDLKSGTSVKKLAGILKGSEKSVLVEAAAVLCPKYKTKVTTYYASTTTTTTTIPARKVTGIAKTLGAGTFTGGTDVAPGLYNVTAGAGQSGNFIVQGTDSYNEVLGGDISSGDVPELRAQISTGDQIQISSLSQVIFTPVTTPLVKTHTPVTLYAGTWTVGQDLGPGRYVATPGAGQSGNFIITNENVNEVLGGDVSSGDVPSVTFTVQNGDTIDISGLSQVILTPS